MTNLSNAFNLSTLSTNLRIFLSTYLPTYLPIYLLSTYLPAIYLATYPSICRVLDACNIILHIHTHTDITCVYRCTCIYIIHTCIEHDSHMCIYIHIYNICIHIYIHLCIQMFTMSMLSNFNLSFEGLSTHNIMY